MHFPAPGFVRGTGATRASSSKSSPQSALVGGGADVPIEPGPIRRRTSEQPRIFIGTPRLDGPAGRWRRRDASKADVLAVLRRR